MSDSSRHARLSDLFLRAVELPRREREGFLARECAGDAALLREVEALLARDDGEPATSEPAAVPTLRGGEWKDFPPRIGNYRVLGEIGRGGMGSVVLLAVRDDDQFKKRVAIKLVGLGMDSQDVLRRFDIERQVLSALNHPNIARLHDAGQTEDKRPYFVMEYVEGQPIDTYCDSEHLSTTERLKLFCKVCSAVHYAHQNLVVHRDIKPSNILVTSAGEPKLLDFGIAKLLNADMIGLAGAATMPGVGPMTPEYASPEQVQGKPITTATDVYSLGVLLYEILTGHRPYRLKTRVRDEMERIICELEPEKPSTAITRIEEEPASDGTARSRGPEDIARSRDARIHVLRKRLTGDIDNIVLMALRKVPRRRYASAEQFVQDIENHLAGRPVMAAPDTIGYRLEKFVRRNRAAVAAGAVIAVLLVGAVVGTSAGMLEARRQAGVAKREKQAANQARAESDSQAEFLRVVVGDLIDGADRLRGAPDATVARTRLAEDLLAVVRKLEAQSSDDPRTQALLGRALLVLAEAVGGERSNSAGDADQAMRHNEAALAALTAAQAAIPDDPSVESDRLKARVNIAKGLEERGRLEQSLQMYDQVIAEASSSRHADDAGVRWSRLAAMGESAGVLRKLDRTTEAAQRWDELIEIRRRAVADGADWREKRSLAIALNDRAGLYSSENEWETALKLCQESKDLRESIEAPDYPDTIDRDRINGRVAMALILQKLGRFDDAIAEFDPWVDRSFDRVAASPTAERAYRDWWTVNYNFLRVLVNASRPEVAASHLARMDRALREYIRLRPGDQKLTQWSEEIAKIGASLNADK